MEDVMEESLQGYRSLSHSKWDCKCYGVSYSKRDGKPCLGGQQRAHVRLMALHPRVMRYLHVESVGPGAGLITRNVSAA